LKRARFRSPGSIDTFEISSHAASGARHTLDHLQQDSSCARRSPVSFPGSQQRKVDVLSKLDCLGSATTLYEPLLNRSIFNIQIWTGRAVEIREKNISQFVDAGIGQHDLAQNIGVFVERLVISRRVSKKGRRNCRSLPWGRDDKGKGNGSQRVVAEPKHF
jgi:hypothetical protein